MGRDTGIELHTREPIGIYELPDYVRHADELVYFRKCHSIARAIDRLLGVSLAEGGEVVEVPYNKIDGIIDVLVDTLKNPEDWDSIWSFEEQAANIALSIAALSWVKQYLRDNPGAYLTYYDSF